MGGDETVFVTQATCEQTTARVLESQQQVMEKLEGIDKRLFHDNGTLSVQTRLDRHEQFIRVLLWALAIVVGTVLTSAVMGLILIFRWALSQGAVV